MCGICGIWGDSSRQNLEAMLAAMNHRGPDDSGMFQDDVVALGMTRLAVIDITPKGHQPMGNHNGTVWIVYNGETYNFQQERTILAEKGYSFSSTSDTEVILRMYEHYGDDFLQRMRGMFSLALYDKRRRGKERLLLARDHFGIKPLLYARVGSRLMFASEVKAILASGIVERAVEPEALRLLLTYGSILQPMTALKGVTMLLPGHKLVIENGSERMERFWKLETNRRGELGSMPYEGLVAEVRATLEESVRLQMVSDVPIGAFLSGGIDSSLLVALMAKISGQKIRTFSIGFEAEGAHMDETDDAERLANFIGTDHTRVPVTGKDVRDRIMHIAYALDQPSVDGVNAYFVSLAAKSRVTVAITGTGGDELFAGYPWFITMVAAFHKDRRHPWLCALKRAVSRTAQQSLLDPFIAGTFGTVIDRVRTWSGFVPRFARIHQIFRSHGAAAMLSPDVRGLARVGREASLDIASSDELPSASPIERVSSLCLRGYTQNQLLRDIDAVSMSHALEVRVPFLDPVVTDLALSLPPHAKLGDLSGLARPEIATYRESGSKKILIDAGRDVLPQGMDLQKKRGFGMPFDAWLRNPLRDILDDVLSPSSVKQRGLFDVKGVRSVSDKFLAGKISWVYPWLLMITELWCREVFDTRGSRSW